MSEVFTVVRAPAGMRNHIAFSERGRMTRAEAISSVRRRYQSQLEQITEFLSIPEDELSVRVERGLYRSKLIEELKP